MTLGPKQREYLHHRLAREFLWKNIGSITTDERNRANQMATTVLDTIENAATSATTLKTAVMNIVKDLEETA